MKNLKKLALMLAVVMSAAIFSACGEDSSSEGKLKDDYSVSVPHDCSVSQAEESSAVQNAEFTRGTVENGVYTSGFGGIKFTAPEGWEFANDEYIASMMNIGLEYAGKNDEMTKAMLEQTTIYDTMCTETATGKNILIMYENLAKEVPDPDKVSVEDYISMMDEQFRTIDSVTCTKNGGSETVDIGGKDFVKQAYISDYGNVKVNQIYYLRKTGKYILGIIMSSGDTDDDMSSYESFFK